MIFANETNCPHCGGQLKYYDRVSRIVRSRLRTTERILIRRLRCINCGKVHRELPTYIMPYKQYSSDIIDGVINGHITQDTLGFEDYPCSMTMTRWIHNTYE